MILFLVAQAQAQQSSPYFTNKNDQKYITYLINSGQLKLEHPLCQPFSFNELKEGLSESVTVYDKHWQRNILCQIDKYKLQDSADGMLYLEGAASAFSNVSNSTENFDFSLNPAFGYFIKNIGFFYRFDINSAYKRDTLFFNTSGKMLNKNFARASDAWLQIDGTHTRFYAGRMQRNYGALNEPGLHISDKPFSYDQVAFEAFNRKLKFTYFVTRLEDVNGFDIRDTVPFLSLSKRFLTFHRLDFSVGKKLHLAFSESILFGGKDNFPMFQYLNPANVFFFSKMSDRKNFEEASANAFMSFDIFYKPFNKLSLYGQVLVDDIDFEKSLRAIYPDRLGFFAKFIYSDLLPGTQIYLKYNKISNWTYNSFYTWGNYTYYGRSLGYPLHGAENVTLGCDIFRFNPFILTFNFQYQRNRQQDLSSPFIAQKTDFPYGITQYSKIPKFEIMYYPSKYINISIEADYGYYQNFENRSFNNKWLLQVFGKITLTGFYSR